MAHPSRMACQGPQGSAALAPAVRRSFRPPARRALRIFVELIVALGLLGSLLPTVRASTAVVGSSGLSLIVGDYVQFGKYNGAPIMWRVLYANIDRVMLFSDRIISLKPYDVTESNYWPNSNIREWLNSSADYIHPWRHKRPNGDYILHRQNEYDEEPGFLADCNFTNVDRNAILETQRRATVSLEYEAKSTGGGTVLAYDQIADNESRVQVQDNLLYQTVGDRVFFLTLREVKELLIDRKYDYYGYPTQQALDKNATGAQDATTSTILSYWLQSPNFEDSKCLYTVNEHSDIWTPHRVVRGSFDGETNAKKDTVGIRPAMYINPTAVVIEGGSGLASSPYKVAGTVETFTRTASFTDVSETAWYRSYVIEAYELGLMNGISTTRFNPQGILTVAELLTTCLNLLVEAVDMSGDYVNWYDPFVLEALRQGLVKKEDSFYKRLSGPVSRNEMAMIILRAVESLDADVIVADYSWAASALTDSDEIPARYREAVYKAYASGILKGNGNGKFNGDSFLTRAETATVMVRVMKRDFILPPKR